MEGKIDSGRPENGGSRVNYRIRKPLGVPLKLFVGQIPLEWDEHRVKDYFSNYGEIMDVLVNKNTKKDGVTYAFVKFASMTQAEEAVKRLTSEPTTLPNATGPIQIRWADGESARLGIEPNTAPRLYVGSIPATADEEVMQELFSKYGTVESISLAHEDNDPAHKGYGFVNFDRKEAALLAVQDLNERAYIMNSDRPLEVRIADRRGPHHQSGGGDRAERGGGGGGASGGGGGGGQHLPVTFQPSRYMQCYDEAGRPYYYDCMTQATEWGMAPQDTPMRRSMNFGANKPGAPGCNLFIYYIPTDWDVHQLVELFNNYGKVVSARIVATNGASKGYGFATYENAEEAKRAIDNLDGFRCPGSKKKLKVSLKTEKPGEYEGGSTSLEGLEYKYAPY